MITKVVLLLILLSALTAQASQAPSCSELFSVSPQSSAEKNFVVWYRKSMSERVNMRPGVQDVSRRFVQQFSQQRLQGLTRGPLILKPEAGSNGLEVFGGFRKADGKLVVVFNIIALRMFDHNTDPSGRLLEYGESQKGLGVKMADFAFGLVNAIRSELAQSPEIKHVELKAIELVNPNLKKLLAKYGFVESSTDSEMMVLGLDQVLDLLPTP